MFILSTEKICAKRIEHEQTLGKVPFNEIQKDYASSVCLGLQLIPPRFHAFRRHERKKINKPKHTQSLSAHTYNHTNIEYFAAKL